MTTGHDYAGCERDPCVRCHDYGLGWSHGKIKAYEEVVQVASGRHDAACDCQPCRVIREVLRGKGWRPAWPPCERGDT